MKRLIKMSVIGVLVVSAYSTQASAQADKNEVAVTGQEGGGGDAIAMEFIGLSRHIAQLLKSKKIVIEGIDPDKFHTQVENTKITTVEKTILNDVEVDAINYPNHKKIQISRARWSEYGSNKKRKHALVMHEFLSLMGIQDDRYQITGRYLAQLDKLDKLDAELNNALNLAPGETFYDKAKKLFDNSSDLELDFISKSQYSAGKCVEDLEKTVLVDSVLILHVESDPVLGVVGIYPLTDIPEIAYCTDKMLQKTLKYRQPLSKDSTGDLIFSGNVPNGAEVQCGLSSYTQNKMEYNGVLRQASIEGKEYFTLKFYGIFEEPSKPTVNATIYCYFSKDKVRVEAPSSETGTVNTTIFNSDPNRTHGGTPRRYPRFPRP